MELTQLGEKFISDLTDVLVMPRLSTVMTKSIRMIHMLAQFLLPALLELKYPDILTVNTFPH